MEIKLPDINRVISGILPVKSKFDNKTQAIEKWVLDKQESLKKCQKLLRTKSDTNDIEILKRMYIDLLMRSMRGESAVRLENSLNKHIKAKSDLTMPVFRRIMAESHYRWVNDGPQVMAAVAKHFQKTGWDWKGYFGDAQAKCEDDFTDDALLNIKHVSYKVRDLAISNFNENYIANDLHIVRVSTRLGLLNYGYEFLPDKDGMFEMGNNPGDRRNYLFLHKLFIKLAKKTKDKYSLADLDTMFWHFGRMVCGSSPMCKECPVRRICLTGA